jgi:acetoin utilization protein AcuB
VLSLEGELVGIVTATDLFEALLRLTGVEKPSGRLEVVLQDRPGELAGLTGFLAQRHVNIHSLLTYPEGGQVRSILRLGTLETRKLAGVLREMGYKVLWPPVKG